MAATNSPFSPTRTFLLRAATGLDTAQAAALIGVKSSDLRRCELGRSEPSPEILERLAQHAIDVGHRPGAGKFRFIDLFAGIGGMRRAFEGAGGECVFTAEWNKYALETYVANHGANHPIIGDITAIPAEDVPDHDVLVGGFPCFPAGTLIETDTRQVPIENIKPGDLVATHNRRLRKVLTVMRKDDAELFEVSIVGIPSFKTTLEHPFYVRKKSRVWNNTTRKHDTTYSNPEWVEAGDLTNWHYAALPMDDPAVFNDDRSPEFWYIVGRWLGDGWVVDHPRMEAGHEQDFMKKAIICSDHDDAEILKSAIDAAGLDASTSFVRSIVNFHILSDSFVELLSEFGRGEKGKQIPRRIFSAPVWVQEALWKGWLDAAGHGAVTSVNRALSLGMARIARNVFGRVASVELSKVSATVNRGDQYHTTLATSDNDLTFIEGGFAWARVNWVDAANEKTTVHNLEVEEDNSYVAEGVVVHNCQPFSLAGVSKKNSLGRAHGFADETQGTLFFDVARIIQAKRPRMFLLENVKNLRDHDKGRTFKVILKTLQEELGYTVTYRVMDGSAWVPQKRKRIFIVGVRDGEAFDFDRVVVPEKGPTIGDILHKFGDAEENGRYQTGGRALPKYTLTDNLWRYLQDYAAKHAKNGNGFGYGMVGEDDVARTLSARYGKDGSEILVRQVGSNPRRLTPRECARLMGFDNADEKIVIPVSDAQAYRQFGNSVIVPGVRAIADVIGEELAAALSPDLKLAS